MITGRRRWNDVSDLIDTLWNVKVFANLGEQPVLRFNRYIVECKGVQCYELETCDW